MPIARGSGYHGPIVRARSVLFVASVLSATAACGARSSLTLGLEIADEAGGGGAGGDGQGGAGAQGAGGEGGNGGDGTGGCGAPETCNGFDDNCDGQIDEGNPGGGQACGTGQAGVCGQGTTPCAAGILSCVPNAQPSPEVCNGLDDDCDGQIDNGGAVLCDCLHATFAGHTYYFCDTHLSWPEAQATCEDAGVQMLSIGSKSEDDFAFDTANTVSNEKWWIGLNDQAVEGKFVWESGSPFSYDGWAPGEPNDAGGAEDCTQLNRFYPEKGWNDEPCESPFFFICESP